ncbi:MAG: hypothetical protein AB7O64_19380 [Methylibium sp.]
MLANELPLRWLWLAAMTAVALRGLIVKGWEIGTYLVDSDDALRLVEVRELIAGAPWFDTTTLALGGDAGLVSHWSRLVDLPLALLLAGLRLVLPETAAELALRAMWPLIVLAPMLWVLALALDRACGRVAAGIGLALAVMSPLGLYQFDPGRIDHHNVMIAATVSAALMMWAWPKSRTCWTAAGALCALALAVGYEALAPVAVVAGVGVVWGLADREQARAARALVVGLAVTLAAAFVLTVSPTRWFEIRCDGLSLNLVVLAAIGAAGVVVAFNAGGLATWHRIGVLAAAGFSGLGIGGWLEPVCLAGPMAQLPPALGPIWLDLVVETRSVLLEPFLGKFDQAPAVAVFLAAAVAAQAARVRRGRSWADMALLVMVAAFAVLALWQHRFMAYGSFMAVVPLAMWCAGLGGWRGLQPATVRIAAVVLVSQAFLLGIFKQVDIAAGVAYAKPAVGRGEMIANGMACLSMPALKTLGALPPGLFAAHIDLGAHLAAVTRHRALAGPYHRIGDAIIANHEIFAARSPEAAARLLAAWNVDYVVTCRGLDGPLARSKAWQGTLGADLVAGRAPPYLVPVPLADRDSLYNVWRVERSRLPPD